MCEVLTLQDAADQLAGGPNSRSCGGPQTVRERQAVTIGDVVWNKRLKAFPNAEVKETMGRPRSTQCQLMRNPRPTLPTQPKPSRSLSRRRTSALQLGMVANPQAMSARRATPEPASNGRFSGAPVIQLTAQPHAISSVEPASSTPLRSQWSDWASKPESTLRGGVYR